MSPLQVSIWMAAPASDVFAACSDFEHAAERIQGIKELVILTEGPVGVGTRFRETRTMFNRDATEEMQITQFVPGESYTVEADSCGNHFVSRFDFRPEGEGTRVEMSMSAEPQTLLARLMAPLGWLMARTMKKVMQQDLEDIKSHVEASRATN